MIYIIGGITRSGKSLLARRLSKKYGVSYFNLDHLMMAMLEGPVDFEFQGETHDREKADKAWPFLQPFFKSIVEHELDGYVVEGALLRPNHAAKLMQQYDGKVKSCWMGYAKINEAQKVESIRDAHGLPGDWLKNADDDYVKMIAEYGINYSKEVQKECEALDIPFIDTSDDFEEALKSVENILINE